jgi:hypothetical protein
MIWSNTQVAVFTSANNIQGVIPSSKVDKISANKVIFPSGKTFADLNPSYQSPDSLLENFQFSLSDSNATAGAKETYAFLARRMAGYADIGTCPILFGQESGTWSSYIQRFDFYGDLNNTKNGHDALSCDLHRSTGYYPSVLALNLAEANQTMGPNRALFTSNANTYFEAIKPRIDRAWARGDCHITVSWDMPWPLEFGVANEVSSFSSNPPVSVSISSANWVYRKYINSTTNISTLSLSQFTSSDGLLANVALTLTTDRHARNIRWKNDMLGFIQTFFSNFSKTYPNKGVELRLLHRANEATVSRAFWWNLLTPSDYQTLYQYSIQYLRNQGVNNMLVNYNLNFAPLSTTVKNLNVGDVRVSPAVYTEEDIISIVACQVDFPKQLRERYPGSSNCDIISINLN